MPPETAPVEAAPRPPNVFAMIMVLCGSMAFAVGGAFMKASDGLTRFTPTLVVLISFVVGAGLLTRAVASSNLSTTLVVGLGIEAVLTMIIGFMFLGDRVSLGQAAGMILVVGGVALVELAP